MPVRNEERHLVEALESLTAQTEPRLRIFVLDNSSTDRTHELASAVAREDGRVTVERTPRPLEMVDNWVHAFRRAREIHPGVPYFAWAGGHDRWDPRWLETLALKLDALPEAVGAFPLGLEIDAAGQPLGAVVSRGGTAGIRLARERAALRLPGTTVHALFRPECLERTGLGRRVLFPDLLLLAEVAAVGPLEEVRETLWYSRATSTQAPARTRQSASLFTGRVPAHARLPWPLVHAGVLLWALGVRGNGVLPRREGPGVAHSHVNLYGYTIAWRWRRRLRRRRRAIRNRSRALWSRGLLAMRRAPARLPRKRREVARRLRKARRRFAKRVKRGGRALARRGTARAASALRGPRRDE
jgi:glycosyltransferase involved in cell wall biosynthesis